MLSKFFPQREGTTSSLFIGLYQTILSRQNTSLIPYEVYSIDLFGCLPTISFSKSNDIFCIIIALCSACFEFPCTGGRITLVLPLKFLNPCVLLSSIPKHTSLYGLTRVYNRAGWDLPRGRMTMEVQNNSGDHWYRASEGLMFLRSMFI